MNGFTPYQHVSSPTPQPLYRFGDGGRSGTQFCRTTAGSASFPQNKMIRVRPSTFLIPINSVMTEIPKPTVQAFLVCDQVIEDSMTKKKSLIGIFTHLQAPSFPFQHQQMGLYFCLTDAEGLYHFDIDLIYLNSEQLVCRATLPNIDIGDRLQISDFGINVPLLIFPAPGRYEFRLRMEGHLIAQKDFSVTPPPDPSAAKPSV